MTRDSRHSPNGRDGNRLGAEPEWRGGEANRPIAALFTTTEQYMRTRFSDLYTFTAQLREERGE